jgi:hypothetical protein
MEDGGFTTSLNDAVGPALSGRLPAAAEVELRRIPVSTPPW